MLLKRFIENTLAQLDGVQGGTVDFDVGISMNPTGFGDMAEKIIVDSSSSNRLRFSIKLETKITEAKEKEL